MDLNAEAMKIIHEEQEKLVEKNIAPEVMKDRLVLELAKKLVIERDLAREYREGIRW